VHRGVAAANLVDQLDVQVASPPAANADADADAGNFIAIPLLSQPRGQYGLRSADGVQTSWHRASGVA
jgi:hypothetical protein